MGVGGEEGESATKLLFDLRSAVIIKFLLQPFFLLFSLGGGGGGGGGRVMSIILGYKRGRRGWLTRKNF